MEKLTKFFIYLSLASPLLVNRSLFFPFITGKALFFRTAVELGLVSFVITLITNSDKMKAWVTKIKQPLFVAVTTFALMFVLTSLTAVNKGAAFWSNFERAEGAWQILHYFVFFALASLVFSSKKEWINLIRWNVVIGFFIALYGLFQYLKIWPSLIVHPENISGTLGNPSYLAIYLIFSLFFITWLLQEEKKWSFRSVWLIIGAFDLFMIYQTHTRASFLALTVGLVIAVCLLAWHVHRSHRAKISKKFLTFCYLAMLVSVILVSLGATFTVLNIKGDAFISMKPRFWTWSSALAGFIDKPLLGWGAENFPYVFDKYYNANHFGIESWFDRPHNIFLEYLIDGGLILLASYLSIFFFFYKKILKLPRAWFWPILFVLPIIYLINGLTLFEILPVYIMLFFFLAFFSNYASQFQSSPSIATVKKDTSPLGWLAVCLTIFLVTNSLYFTIYRPLQKNLLLIQALRTRDRTLQDIYESFRQAVTFYSPVGQAEIDQQMLHFTNDLIDWLGGEKLVNSEIQNNIVTVTQLAEEWYVQDRPYYIGVKNTYLMLSIYIKAHKITDQKKFLEKADQLVKKEIELAPTRIELLKQQLQVAELTKNDDLVLSIRRTIKKLRPDL